MNSIEVKKFLDGLQLEIQSAVEEMLDGFKCDMQHDIDCIYDELAVLRQQICELEPKKSYIDLILEQKDDVTLTQISRDYGFENEDKLVNFLVGSCGFNRVNLFCDKKYRLEIYYALKSHGILPLIERKQEDKK